MPGFWVVGRVKFVIKYLLMKKITILSLALMFALSACSLDEVVALLVTPTSPPLPSRTLAETATPTVFQTPSNTPTITPVPSFTTTPTLSGSGSNDSVSSDSPTAESLPTLYVVPTATSAPQTNLFGGQNSIVVSMSVSNDVLYWGYCDAQKYVDFEVRLANNLRVTNVLLFMRLVDKGGNQSTAWGGGAIMKEAGGSSYTYRVRPENIAYYEEFKDAWIQYQVVAATYGLKSLGRSPVVTESLSLRKCEPTETDE